LAWAHGPLAQPGSSYGFLANNPNSITTHEVTHLPMSGIALGKSVLSSGLSNDMDTLIERVLKGLSLWPITIIFGFLVLITSTSISHTVASVLSIPIAFKIGNREFS
ncbi:hypothetical protein PSHT_12609, partial [Puccinia striiformis]